MGGMGGMPGGVPDAQGMAQVCACIRFRVRDCSVCVRVCLCVRVYARCVCMCARVCICVRVCVWVPVGLEVADIRVTLCQLALEPQTAAIFVPVGLSCAERCDAARLCLAALRCG